MRWYELSNKDLIKVDFTLLHISLERLLNSTMQKHLNLAKKLKPSSAERSLIKIDKLNKYKTISTRGVRARDWVLIFKY